MTRALRALLLVASLAAVQGLVRRPAPRGPRAAEAVQHEDNEAAADEAVQQVDEAAQQGDHQYQEARHFNRLANDDNYEDEQDIVYDFSYEVKDPHTGSDFGHRQSRSGVLTQGQYRVLLPDGRMQVVDYVSDRDGFRPSIRYVDVGLPVFAGSEQHEQFEEQPQQQLNPKPSDERRRRRRRRSDVGQRR